MTAPILVVDDSQVNRVVARSKLREAGYMVESVVDGNEAIEFLKLNDPDGEVPAKAVLLDVMMPGIDGMEVLRTIRKKWDPIQLPVIMATAKEEQEDILEALSEGANDYITKPIDLPVLLARVSTHLHLQEIYSALRDAQRTMMTSARMDAIALLASGVAQQIRKPLGQIQAAMNDLEELAESLSDESKEAGDAVLSTVRNAVRQADRAVNGLMKASAEKSLQLSIEKVPEVLEESLRIMKGEFSDSGVKVQLLSDNTLPEALISRREFQHAFTEVLRNALHASASEEAGPSKTIAIEIKEAKVGEEAAKLTSPAFESAQIQSGETAVAVTITDNGPGMTETEISKAFDAFYTSKPSSSGAGLGLTIARNILHLHGGAIQLENRTDGETGIVATLHLRPTTTLIS